MSTLAQDISIIESATAYKHALGITRDILMNERRTAEDTRRLKTWSVLIRDYERRHFAEMFDKSEPREILRFLLEENGLGQSDIPGIPQSRISAILSGHRDISVQQAHKLGDFFKVNFALFLK